MPDPDDLSELRAERSRQLLARLAAGGEGRAAAREALVHLHTPLVVHCARRFAGRGEPQEDLVQVGMIGLLLAIDRFDPGRGLELGTFATPTILGELRRWFRDKGWAVRVPRGLQELRARIVVGSADLAQELGRPPSAAEVAAVLGCRVEEVVEGLTSAAAYAAVPWDTGQDGTEDEALAQVEVRESVRPLLEGLPTREKQVLLLRFFAGLTQSQIAAEVGVSQMQVSRVLSRTLDDLRAALDLPRARAPLRARGPAAPPTPGAPRRARPTRR